MHYSINLTSAIFLLTTLATTTDAFTVTYYTGSGCRSGAPTTLVQRPESGCQTFMAGTSKSQIIKGDRSDISMFMVYFSDKECNPDNIIKKADLGKDFASTCVDTSSGYGSFQVYDLCQNNNCLAPF